MKKTSKILLSVLLAFVMVIFSACSDGDIKQPTSVNGEPGVNSETDADSNNDSSDAEDIGDASQSDIEDNVTVSETVLYDTDGIKVTATGYEDGWMGPEIKLLIENNSAQNVLVTSDSVSANGYMMPYAGFYADVAAGKKANDSLSVYSSELKQAGIETIAELQFYIQVSDADTWDSIAKSDLITLNTSAAGLEQPIDDSGDILYDTNDIKIVCKGLKQDIIWDGTIVFYIENNCGQPITVYAENVSVNGFMQLSGMWSDLRDGTMLVDGMSLLDLDDLEVDSIDDIENIEFNLRIINSDTWDEIDTTDVISLDFQ